MKPEKKSLWRRIVPCACFLVLLVLYPLRHARTGVDLWDGGYNYANFMFAGTEYMDSMWYFATWISNGVGALLMKLPFADTMLGMNIYTGLIVSLLASAGFLFCVKVLKLPSWLAFLGEIAACSLCWDPTAVLYNYLTFLLLMTGSICLYLGLSREKEPLLAAAGAVLGLNVGVRFSNLVHMGMILAVWLYAYFAGKKWKKVLRETGLCILGYAAALLAFFLFMGIRYGFGEYVGGILRLFQMTETAEDYTPGNMLLGMVWAYYDSLYWIKRFLLVLALEMGICAVAPGRWERMKKLLSILLTCGLFYWLSENKYYSLNYATYDAIMYPSVMILVLTLCLSVFFMAKKNIPPEEKLPAMFAVPTILLTSLGGNNAIYYSFNNMFLLLPFFLYMVWKFCRGETVSVGRRLLLFPAKTILAASLFIFFVQALGFGRDFVYEEAAGGVAMTSELTEVPVLKGIRTNSGKARELTELYRYLEGNCLREKRVILYGNIPGVAYYMELTPAISIWGDLRSYTHSTMQGDMEELAGEISGGEELPIVILEGSWNGYLEDPAAAWEYWDQTAVQKLWLIRDFLINYSYEKVYDNGKYVVFNSDR